MAKHKQKICVDCATIQTAYNPKKCKACSSKNLIPMDTPKGADLAEGQTVPAMESYWTPGRIALGVLMVAILIGSLSEPSPSSTQANKQPASNPNLSKAKADKSPELGAATSDQSEWVYSVTEDEMTDDKTYFARISSLNTANFSFPYAGAQHAELMLRTHPRYGKDVIFSIERGQFLCGLSECRVLVRFDDGKPITFAASEPNDRSTTALFIQNYSDFTGRLLKAKRVLVQAEYYQHGATTFEFNVEGFSVERYRPKN